MKKNVMRVVTAAVATLAAFTVIAAVAICIVFPNKYASAVNAAADEFGLDRSLVRSVVWAESKFDPNATSPKGAKGLMQLMPDTFEFCANALYIKDGKNKMFDPECSLRCGCYYLSLLLDKFDGDEKAALVAYNAGEANARKFLAGEQSVFAETQKYLNDINKAKKIYGFFG